MTARKPAKKPYDYNHEIRWAVGVHGYNVCGPQVRRILRKLVREAVAISWHRAGDESTEDLADRIAKELVP